MEKIHGNKKKTCRFALACFYVLGMASAISILAGLLIIIVVGLISVILNFNLDLGMICYPIWISWFVLLASTFASCLLVMEFCQSGKD